MEQIRKESGYYKYRWIWCLFGSIISLLSLTQPTAYTWYVAYAGAGIRTRSIWMYGYYVFTDVYMGTERGWFDYWGSNGVDYLTFSLIISIISFSLILGLNLLINIEISRILIFTRKRGVYNSTLFIYYGSILLGTTLFYIIAIEMLYQNVGEYNFWGTYNMQFGLIGQLIAGFFILLGSIRGMRKQVDSLS